MTATLIIGWPLLSILLTALWSRYRAAQKAQEPDYDLVMAPYRPSIEVEYRRAER